MKEQATKIIVDLYEMRVSTFHKYQSKYEQIEDCSKYQFFTSAIAQLSDKYKVTHEDIKEELRERSLKEKVLG
jgi:hypothetical protein